MAPHMINVFWYAWTLQMCAEKRVNFWLPKICTRFDLVINSFLDILSSESFWFNLLFLFFQFCSYPRN